MPKLPFNVFKRKGRRFYYVKFSGSCGECLAMVSTRTEIEAEALEISFKWYREGIPLKNKNKSLDAIEVYKKIKTKEDTEYLCSELQRTGLLKHFVITDTEQAKSFVSYLENFWDWETSPYVESRLRLEHGIHRRYVKENKLNILKYWKPFFKEKLLGEITKKDIDSLMKSLDRKLSPTRKNKIVRSGTIALKWAFKENEIDHDVTTGIMWFAGKGKKRNILTPELAKAIFTIDWDDERSQLANMLTMCTGLRAGEVLGLRLCDIGSECLYISHSWSSVDKLKTTKTNEARIVELPFPHLVTKLLQLAQRNPHVTQREGFVFWAEKLADKPMEGRLFTKGLRKALITVGMPKETTEQYDFHSWRHFFTAYMKPKLDRKLLKMQTGHRTDGMLEHYGSHALSGERDKIRLAQREVFGELIPL